MSARVPTRGTGMMEQAVVVEKDLNGSGAKSLPHRAEAGMTTAGGNANGRAMQTTAKSLPISKRQVWEAYRQGKPAHQALAQTHRCCWRYAWAVEIDIRGFSENIGHALLLKAVRYHTCECRLRTPVKMPDGTTIQQREKGTPQGGAISPLLASLFLLYAFDMWMQHHHGDVPFERYADDAVSHCHSQVCAQSLIDQLRERFAQCGLELHPQKTQVVFCKDSNRRGDYPDTSFDFFGFTFRPWLSRGRDGRLFVGFNPAVSAKAARSIRGGCNCAATRLWTNLAHMFNAKIRRQLLQCLLQVGSVLDSSEDRLQVGVMDNPEAQTAARPLQAG